MEMIEALDLKTWTPELCIDPSSEPSVLRFAKIAFITETPLLALQALGLGGNKVLNQQVEAGLELVSSRLQALEDGLSADQPVEMDCQSQVILKYLRQQHELMTRLQSELQELRKQQD